ncbi:hypothetical protein IAT38_005638 [Cryptococcus sp. DSM 104549]
MEAAQEDLLPETTPDGDMEEQPSLIDLLQSSTSTDVSSPAAAGYLDHLLSLSLPELLRQPSLISVESSTVESDLTNLCFREYPTFISVHKCSSAVKSAFDDFSGSLGKLIDSIPSLEDECRAFTSSTSSIQRVRGKASLVLEHQDKLQDLLELPQLTETCVRNGYYQEAMELLAHSRSISQRYPGVALVQDVAKEVEGILQLMLAQLLTLLREPVKLPALVKTVGFLRRLNAMDETDLGVVFIASRYHNFRAQLVQIERDRAEPVRYLRKYIDLFREHVYDIIAQFTAIFMDSPEAAPHITAFANQAIADLVALVTAYIPRLSSDSASMSSVLVQLGYCAMSFARVGLDFSPLIAEPFSDAALSAFSQTIASSSSEFSTILRDSAKSVLPPSQTLIAAELIPHILSSLTSPPPPPSGSPASIDAATHYPPIASLVNAHLTAFNNLRLLAPLTLRSQITSVHSSALVASTSVVLQYVSQAIASSELANGSAPPPTQAAHARKHSRNASAPRADLLRRNSEVLMTPEARAAKRREARRVCVASADVWGRVVVPFLVGRLSEVFGEESGKGVRMGKELEGKVEELRKWVEENGEGVVNRSRATADADPATSVPAPAQTNGSTTNPSTPTNPAAPSFTSPFSTSQTTVPAPLHPVQTTSPAATIESMFSPTASLPTSRLPDAAVVPSVATPADLGGSSTPVMEALEEELEAMGVGMGAETATVEAEPEAPAPAEAVKEAQVASEVQEKEVDAKEAETKEVERVVEEVDSMLEKAAEVAGVEAGVEAADESAAPEKAKDAETVEEKEDPQAAAEPTKSSVHDEKEVPAPQAEETPAPPAPLVEETAKADVAETEAEAGESDGAGSVAEGTFTSPSPLRKNTCETSDHVADEKFCAASMLIPADETSATEPAAAEPELEAVPEVSPPAEPVTEPVTAAEAEPEAEASTAEPVSSPPAEAKQADEPATLPPPAIISNNEVVPPVQEVPVEEVLGEEVAPGAVTPVVEEAKVEEPEAEESRAGKEEAEEGKKVEEVEPAVQKPEEVAPVKEDTAPPVPEVEESGAGKEVAEKSEAEAQAEPEVQKPEEVTPVKQDTVPPPTEDAASAPAPAAAAPKPAPAPEAASEPPTPTTTNTADTPDAHSVAASTNPSRAPSPEPGAGASGGGAKGQANGGGGSGGGGGGKKKKKKGKK